MSNKPIGIFGGTFDPIHFGHLRLAEEMSEQLDLGQLRFMPAGIPPHRATPMTSVWHRGRMVQLAIAANAKFVLDERELKRNSPCYTVDSMYELRAEYGKAQSLCLLMGGDAFLSLHTWHLWRELFELVHLVVTCRPGFVLSQQLSDVPSELVAQYQQRLSDVAQLHQSSRGGIVVIDMPLLDISATLIRQKIQAGRSVSYLLPDSVLNYIEKNRLYKNANTRTKN